MSLSRHPARLACGGALVGVVMVATAFAGTPGASALTRRPVAVRTSAAPTVSAMAAAGATTTSTTTAGTTTAGTSTATGRRVRPVTSYAPPVRTVPVRPRTTSTAGAPSPTSTLPPIVPSGQGTCQAVLFYGVRGAGESAAVGDGLGPVLLAHRQRLQEGYGASRVGSYAADYPAVPVTNLASADAWRAPAVSRSVDAGAVSAAANLAALTASCPSSSLVVAGFDEGALVVRRALAALGTSRPAVVGRVSAVFLVGDPALHYADPGILVGGSSPWQEGVLAAAGAVTELDQALTAVHLCHRDDVVCQSNGGTTSHAAYAGDGDVAVAEVAKGLRSAGVTPGVAVRARVVAPARLTSGSSGTYTVTVTNAGLAGTVRAGTLRVGLSLYPGDSSVTAATGTGWTCTTEACTRPVPVGGLAAGASLPPISVVVGAQVTGPVTLTTSMSDVPLGGVTTTNYAWGQAPVVRPPQTARPVPRVTLLARSGPRGGPRWAVELTNTGARATTTAGVQVDLELPSDDAHPAVTSGSAWTCTSVTSCRYTPVLAPGVTSSPLVVDTSADLAVGYQTVHATVEQVGAGGLGPATQGEAAVSFGDAQQPLFLTLTPSVTTGMIGAGHDVTWSAVVSSTAASAPSGTISVRAYVGEDNGGRGAKTLSGTGWNCAQGLCTWVGSAVHAGSPTEPLTITDTVPFDARLDMATAVLSLGDQELRTEQSRLVVTPSGRAHLQPVLTPDASAPGLAGAAVGWTATLVNTGAAATTGLSKVVLDLPDAAANWVISGSGWTCASGTCTTTQTIAAGASSTPVTVRRAVGAGVPALGPVTTLRATADDSGSGGGSGGAVTRSDITRGAGLTTDLAVMVTGITAPAVPGAPARATVVVRNVGSAPVADASVTVSGPQNWDVARSGSGWTCGDPWMGCQPATTLAPGATTPPLTVEVTPSEWAVANGGRLQQRELAISAEVSAFDDESYLNSRATAGFVVAEPGVDLVAQVSAAQPTVVLGSPFTTTVTVRNAGTRSSSGAVSFTWTSADGVGSDLPLTSASGSGWTCDTDARTCTTTAAVAAGGALPSVALTFAPHNESQYHMTGVSLGVTLTASADQDGANNSASATFPVRPGAPDLVGSFLGVGGAWVPGGPGSAVLTLTNAGLQTITSRTVVDFDPLLSSLDLTSLSGSGTGWSCAPVDGVGLRCSSDTDVVGGASLPPLVMTARSPRSADPYGEGRVIVYARWSNSGDQLPGNESAGFTTSLAPRTVDLIPMLSGPSAPVNAGSASAATRTVVSAAVANAGTSPATGTLTLSWEDQGEGDSQVVAASGSGWTCSMSEHACTRPGGLAAGASTSTVSLTVQNVPAAIGNRSRVNISVSGDEDGGADGDGLGLGYPTF